MRSGEGAVHVNKVTSAKGRIDNTCGMGALGGFETRFYQILFSLRSFSVEHN